MNSTNALPTKSGRVTCARCLIESATEMMRDEGTFSVCRNEVACRKRIARHRPTSAPPHKRDEPRKPAPAKRSRRRADEP